MIQTNNPIKSLKTIVDDESLRTWEDLHTPERPPIMDMRYPLASGKFKDLDDEIEGIPTYQIPILLEKIMKDPDPAILSAMKDVLVMASMTYDHDEINEVNDRFEDSKKSATSRYEDALATHQKYLENKKSDKSKIKEETTKFLDEISSYSSEDYSDDKIDLVIELTKFLDPSTELNGASHSKEGFEKIMDKFRNSNPYSLLDKTSEGLHHALGRIKDQVGIRQIESGFMSSFRDSFVADILDCFIDKK